MLRSFPSASSCSGHCVKLPIGDCRCRIDAAYAVILEGILLVLSGSIGIGLTVIRTDHPRPGFGIPDDPLKDDVVRIVLKKLDGVVKGIAEIIFLRAAMHNKQDTDLALCFGCVQGQCHEYAQHDARPFADVLHRQ